MIRVEPDNRLKDRRSQLKCQRDEAHLAEAQLKALLQQRVDRRYDRLDSIVKQMRETHRQQHRDDRTGSLLRGCLWAAQTRLHLFCMTSSGTVVNFHGLHVGDECQSGIL